MRAISDLQPIELIDIIEPEHERSSSYCEEMEENQSQMVYFRKSHIKSRRRSRMSNKIRMDPIIKDFIINKEEYTAEIECGKQVNATRSWALKSANEFFEKN